MYLSREMTNIGRDGLIGGAQASGAEGRQFASGSSQSNDWLVVSLPRKQMTYKIDACRF